MAKILKGLTQRLIKASKDESLGFCKSELENIKNSAEVTIEKRNNGSWVLNVYSRYDACGYGSSFWKGSFIWFNQGQEGEMRIYSGFTGNPIGRVERAYTCVRPIKPDYNSEFKNLLAYMIKARQDSIGQNNSYVDFVVHTGCLD